MADDDLRVKCPECRHYGIIYDSYRREFLADFA